MEHDNRISWFDLRLISQKDPYKCEALDTSNDQNSPEKGELITTVNESILCVYHPAFPLAFRWVSVNRWDEESELKILSVQPLS